MFGYLYRYEAVSYLLGQITRLGNTSMVRIDEVVKEVWVSIIYFMIDEVQLFIMYIYLCMYISISPPPKSGGFVLCLICKHRPHASADRDMSIHPSCPFQG